ncbi:uncharacterized protein LOC135395176 [Ornithodoros turicata]|uniref:uncharacterized protein LOC135395176 n=1 Tax=Ornithodoros turicata TaxID=34597 RepID=UPI00313A42D4
MKTSFLIAAAFLILTCLLGVEAPLPSALGTVIALGGAAGIKLAVAMKILRYLGFFDISRYGVGLRASVENEALPETVVPAPLRSPGLGSGPTISVPVAVLPFLLGQGITDKVAKKKEGVNSIGQDFRLEASQSASWDDDKFKISEHGDASLDGSKGAAVQFGGNLRSPIVNADTLQKASIMAKRSVTIDSHVYDKAFALVRDLDVDDCVEKVTCEIGADPARYGAYGLRVDEFLASLAPLANSSSFYDYQQAYNVGTKSGLEECSKVFPDCKFDLRGIAALLDSSS